MDDYEKQIEEASRFSKFSSANPHWAVKTTPIVYALTLTMLSASYEQVYVTLPDQHEQHHIERGTSTQAQVSASAYYGTSTGPLR